MVVVTERKLEPIQTVHFAVYKPATLEWVPPKKLAGWGVDSILQASQANTQDAIVLDGLEMVKVDATHSECSLGYVYCLSLIFQYGTHRRRIHNSYHCALRTGSNPSTSQGPRAGRWAVLVIDVAAQVREGRSRSLPSLQSHEKLYNGPLLYAAG